MLELKWSFGEFIELNDCWDRFAEAASAITTRMPGIDPHWYEALTQLDEEAGAVVVWQSPDYPDTLL